MMGFSLPARLYAYRFSLRKRRIVRRFAPESKITFIRDCRGVAAGDTLLLWGGNPVPADLHEGVAVIRVEDGFVRSVGLGADLVAPLSWVFDPKGIYFDARQPSRLENLLVQLPDDAALRARAARLRERIVAEGFTKYNVGASNWERPNTDMPIILVPGQVETDASIRFGALGAVRTNMGLLRAVREGNPDAYVIYKPHPDVTAGLRSEGQGEGEAHRWCDAIVTGVGMQALLNKIDEVHVLTSLTGFEALLRGKRVSCYGLPFYAGWGLTIDHLDAPRRACRLTLDELVAGALIRYPRYVSRVTGKPCEPEQVLDELARWRTELHTGLGRTVLRRFLTSFRSRISPNAVS